MASDGIAPRGIIVSSLLFVFIQADVKPSKGVKIDFFLGNEQAIALPAI